MIFWNWRGWSRKIPLAFRDCDLGEIVDWVLAGLNIQVRDKKSR